MCAVLETLLGAIWDAATYECRVSSAIAQGSTVSLSEV